MCEINLCNNVLLFFVSLIILLEVVQVQAESCYDPNTNRSGTCKLLGECPSAIKDIEDSVYPHICGNEGTVPIVCCTGISASTAKPTTTTNVVTTTTRKTTPIPTTQSYDDIPVFSGRLCEQKCAEYGKTVWVLEKPPILLPGATWNNVSICGHKAAPLVVGGQKSEPREFPHMALLGYRKKGSIEWGCGGSLISERFVLTAAHCIITSFGEVRWVRLGDLNKVLTTDDAQPEEFLVTERIKHPDYHFPSKYNDIALVKVNRDVNFNAYIRPACLQPIETLINKKAIATGWGYVEFGGDDSDDMLKVTLDMFDNDTCYGKYRKPVFDRVLKYGIDWNTQICAGSFNESKDTCQGDSGGPLQIYNQEIYCMYTIIGVTSFGQACGVIGNPGVYTRVSTYVTWIESIVWNSV